MAISDLNHYNLRVPREDFERLVRFYVEALGFEFREREADGARLYWLWTAGRPLVHLTVTEGPAGTGDAPPSGALIDHIAFSCEDRAATCARLDGLQIAYRVREFPRMGFTQVVLHDPVGLKIELNISDAAARG
jgi:catechol 2,3-dioxygenase-like lactoylglutathione lyase family enzyme